MMNRSWSGVDVGGSLDEVEAVLRSGATQRALDLLFHTLNSKRQLDGREAWTEWVRDVALRHSLRELLHNEPFTAAAFGKHRGFPGDAGTLDYLYFSLDELRHRRPRLESTLLAETHRYITTRRPSAHAVVGRCRVFAEYLDATAAAGGRRVLSVAGGHFRESMLSQAVRDRRLETVVLDQDERALAEVSSSCADFSVQPVCASIRKLLAGSLDLGDFDLVYSGGLFDYLSDRTAVALLDRLTEHLLPTGRLVVANFVPDHPDAGYMESFMDWHLIYRTPAAMRDLARQLDHLHRIEYRSWADCSGSLAFLEIRRLAAAG